MITDNMRKENEIIVEALTKMRGGAQARLDDALRDDDSIDVIACLVSSLSKFDALISQHTPKQPTKNEALANHIVYQLEALEWDGCRDKDRIKCVLSILTNEEYPE